MKNTVLLKPKSSTFGGIAAPKIGFSTNAKRTASANKAVIATSGAAIATEGPRVRMERDTMTAKRITATPSFHDARIVVACMLVRRTPKKNAIVTRSEEHTSE